jgi:hypothetical protein
MRDVGIVPLVHDNHGRDMDKLRQMLSMRGVHILAIFVFIYAGLEVTMGGKSYFLLGNFVWTLIP